MLEIKLRRWGVVLCAAAFALLLGRGAGLPLYAAEGAKTASGAGTAAAPAAKGTGAKSAGTSSAEGNSGSIGPVPVAKGISIALMVNAGDFAGIAQEAAAAESRRLGVRCRWMGHVAEAEQVQFIERAVKNGYKAIVITPPAKSQALAAEVSAALKAAMQAGVTVIAWDVDPGIDARTLFVSKGSPDRLGAFLVSLAAGQLKANKPAVKKVAFFYDGPENIEVNSWVTEAKRRVLAEHNNWDIVGTHYGYGNLNSSVEIASALLATYEDLDVLICPSQTALLGAARAAEKLGRAGDVAIVGFSAPKAASRYIGPGSIDSCGLWDAASEMRIAVYLAAEIASGAVFSVGNELDVPGLEYHPRIEANPLHKWGDPDENTGMVVPDRLIFSVDNISTYKY